jgi:hypothetical protein
MEEIYRSQFRMPQSLYELLKLSADKNRRSVNAELISRLEQSFSKEDRMRRSFHRAMEGPVELADGDEIESQADDDSGDAPGSPMSHAVSKERLLATMGQDVTDKEHVLLSAMLDALRRIEDPAEWAAAQPSKGPKPRKRYPKE